jgi:hypothetical protein
MSDASSLNEYDSELVDEIDELREKLNITINPRIHISLNIIDILRGLGYTREYARSTEYLIVYSPTMTFQLNMSSPGYSSSIHSNQTILVEYLTDLDRILSNYSTQQSDLTLNNIFDDYVYDDLEQFLIANV